VSVKIIRYPPHTGVACSIFFVSTHSQHISMLIVFVFPLRIITRALNSHAYLLISNCCSYKGIHPFFWATMNQLLSCHHTTSTMVFFWAPKLPAKADSDFLQANTNHYMKQLAILPNKKHHVPIP
jgi:hypothetical protein